MSAALDIRFLDSYNLEKPEDLEKILHVFLNMGFKVEEFEIGKQPINFEPNLANKQEWFKLAQHTKNCYFLAQHLEWQLEIRQYVAWDSLKIGRGRRAWIVTSTNSTAYFRHDRYNPEFYAKIYLEIGKALYTIIQPTFGWSDLDYGLRTSHEDIESLALPHLYWANFFGPAYVEKLGRSRIMSAPAWQIQELGDGGILYVLGPSPSLSEGYIPVEVAQQHFGIN
jgi:hypothetical protein